MIKFDHVNICAVDQEAMRDFLVDSLGLRVGDRPAFKFPGYWLYLGDQAIVHLMGKEGRVNTEPGWIDHIAFGPFDFDGKCAELDSAGVIYKTARVPGMALRQIFVPGPEGVKLELQCPDNAAAS